MEKNIEVREERIGRRIKQVGAELRKLRSKSCGRIFSQQRGGFADLAVDEAACNTVEKKDNLMNNCQKVDNSIMTGPYQGWARALVDYVPSPYDKVALPFRSGELIHLTGRGEGGMWWGECGGRRGAFKCVTVEVLNDYNKPKENRKQTNYGG